MPQQDGSNLPQPATPPRFRYCFPRRLRITRKSDFDRAMKTGVRLTDRYVTVWGRANGLEDTRLGLAVGRRHGTAVQRNRLKRLLREAFRLSYPQLPRGLDLVCVPQAGAELTLAGLLEALPRLAARLGRRLLPPGQTGAQPAEGLQDGDGPASGGTLKPRDDAARGTEP